MPGTVAILAGGLATRLHPLTETIPKALVPVAGRPFLAHQLALLAKHDLTDIVLCVGHLGEQIESTFGNGQAYGVRLHYSYDGPNLRGTAGALRKALPLLGDIFYVLYGDSYLEIDYSAVVGAFHEHQWPALMTIIENAGGSEPSNVWYEEGRIRSYDKKRPVPQMRYIDYGFTAWRAEVISKNELEDLSAFQADLAARGLLYGYEVATPYHEIGSHQGLKALETHLKNQP